LKKPFRKGAFSCGRCRNRTYDPLLVRQVL
jgi:hypothetical protein